MTQNEIIRMAREAGLEIGVEFIAGHKTNIERFAALVAAHEREKQAEQEPVACNCGTNPWHDCNESEGCRIKKTLGISSRPVYDQRADHHKMMLGYEIATKYGVFENKAFQLCDEMKKLYAAPQPVKQEPVAWCYYFEDELWGFFTDPDECDPDCDNEMPLYAAPVSVEAAVLAEREACAKVCEEGAAAEFYGEGYTEGFREASTKYAAAIRAR